ncbi:MAG: glycine dehydrogenase (aminomethyl-transferring) [Candidatus Melainabacteria bacterium RIFOXYA12_FULL_32_12]|nr:MAG: glycine dehydrogenase (aminomethyl-transferring) [Candidatus Melainabacteria bacterium RIFOXYA2_FULL_32_9]OGI31641.1 MAG: glycine dehydrogenase (aminomethyl-transferring) [Candidatus Melainabacteria bacterium RIFOXYA12_FULL_32_12]
MTEISFEKSIEGRRGVKFPEIGIESKNLDNYLPKDILRENKVNLPELTELDVMRHFINLSQKNFSVDTVFYPLGSCTMKYNPKINEFTANLDGLVNIHPEQSEDKVQGALQLMYELQEYLKEITGMNSVTLQPAAGAHGEFVGMLIVKAYFEKLGEKRTKVIIPDSAHGTNPATAKMCGFDVIEIKSNSKGMVDIEELKKALNNDVAALMMTNPNTLGLFEENILEISQAVHEAGALLYYDGANLNAIMGITNPALMGFDIVHINLHKTFSTPHGGGGPGSGPVGVVDKLASYLPIPIVGFDGQKYHLNYNLENTIGKVKAFYGNFGVLVRAYTYILMMGKKGLRKVSEDAVLNANYLKEHLKDYYKLPYDQICMHEFVLSGENQKAKGVNTIGIAKRLMDFDIHPPTVYFPLIVPESIMIEPTETESRETLDNFIDVMKRINTEIENDPTLVLESPLVTSASKVDETLAARQPNLRWI